MENLKASIPNRFLRSSINKNLQFLDLSRVCRSNSTSRFIENIKIEVVPDLRRRWNYLQLYREDSTSSSFIDKRE